MLAAVTTACAPDREHRALHDAAIDAPCTQGVAFIPVAISGTSPIGDLSRFRFMNAGYAGGFCAITAELRFTERADHCWDDPALALRFRWYPDEPVPAPGQTVAASASARDPAIGAWPDTEAVRFQVEQIDPPFDEATGTTVLNPRIAGRFVANVDGWAFDIAVDTFSQGTSTCL